MQVIIIFLLFHNTRINEIVSQFYRGSTVIGEIFLTIEISITKLDLIIIITIV